MKNSPPVPAPHSAALRGIALAALLIAIGNIASRVLGLVREATIAAFFGRSPPVDAYRIAWTVPNTLYELLITGAVSAALVPVFSEFAEGDADEFWRIVSSVATILLLALTLLVALLIWQAPLAAMLLVQPERADLRPLTAELIQLLLPAVLLMGVAGLMTAVLHARRAFLLPAFAGTIFNLGMIAGIVAFHERFEIASLALGALIGGAGQVLIQSFGLRDARYRPALGLHHPAVRRILWLYAPVAIGISFSLIGSLIDRRLASGFPAGPATMAFATTLIQFPLGLVAAAVSLAVLPTLSRQSAVADDDSFRITLAMGLKIVLLLVVPATIGLGVLAEPITSILFQRREFDQQDTAATALALLFYLPGLPAAALDQVLLFAFYARKQTLTPNLVQGLAVGCYLLTALTLLAFTQLGFLALVLGNAAQWICHALVLLWLMQRQLSLRRLRLGEALFKALAAAGVMGVVVLLVARSLADLPPLLVVAAGGASGGLVYLAASVALRTEALVFFWGALRSRFARR